MHSISASVSPETFLAIISVAAIAGTLAEACKRVDVAVPVVVIELLGGVVLGGHLLGLQVSSAVSLFKDLGLGLLFFFAGYEIDLRRILGRPLRLAMAAWLLSLVLAYLSIGVLHAAGMSISILYVGSAIATTAIGTLIPILSDNDQLHTRFGTYMLAAGAVGEFGPILMLTLVLSARGSTHNAAILLAFVAIALAVAAFAIRAAGRTLPLLRRTIAASSQLAVRWVLVLLFGLALLAYRLGLDLLLGGFAAGVIVGEMLRDRPLPEFDSKLSAVAFGVFVPFFFVVSGMQLDISAFATPAGVLRTLMILGLMLLVRGIPVMLLYRQDLDRSERRALALMSSAQLPLVLAIATLARASGQIGAAIAADLVGAAVLSTLIFPLLGLRQRRQTRGTGGTSAATEAPIAVEAT